MRCCSSKKYLQNLRSTFLSIKNFTTVNSVITIFTINFNNDFAITHVRYFRFKTGLSCEHSFSQRLLLFVIVFHSSSQPRTQALSSMRRKDPGRGWSRGSQILGAKLKFCQGRSGRGVCCLYLRIAILFLIRTIKFIFAIRDLEWKNSQKYVFVYMTRLPV